MRSTWLRSCIMTQCAPVRKILHGQSGKPHEADYQCRQMQIAGEESSGNRWEYAIPISLRPERPWRSASCSKGSTRCNNELDSDNCVTRTRSDLSYITLRWACWSRRRYMLCCYHQTFARPLSSRVLQGNLVVLAQNWCWLARQAMDSKFGSRH
jgi:hypothetical protein